MQGQKDTLFNLQEAVATYRALQAQGTPTRMIWQSWGHSGSTPAPGELDFGATSLRDSYLGNRFLNWMNHYVKGNAQRPDRPAVLLLPRLGRATTPAPAYAGTAIRKAYARAARSPQDPTATLYFTGNDAPDPDEGRGHGRLRVLRQRRPGAHVVLRDLGPRGRPGEQPAERRPRHRSRRSPPRR